MIDYTSEEMMAVAASRKFRNRAACFVGVGLPSVAACLARDLHAPDITLVYESGAIDAKPAIAPLSIADIELAETADFIVSVPAFHECPLNAGRQFHASDVATSPPLLKENRSATGTTLA